jgi:hypothetical protein
MFKDAIDIFRVFGFRFKIDPSWFLIAALIVRSLSTTYFPIELPEYTRSVDIAKLLASECEALAKAGLCRYFCGVIGPEAECIGAGATV